MSSVMQFFTVIFILVIVLSLFVSCNSESPFYMDNIFQKYSRFENFANNSNAMDYSSSDAYASMDTYKPFLINQPEAECKKIDGFNGLFCKPKDTGDNLDKFADAEGKPDCKDSSGLTNSKGGLCLTPEHKRLLSTRGGNSTGGSAEIGH